MQLTTTTTGDGARHVGLVHGLGGNGATWQPLVDLMLGTGSYTVTTVDLRGHGSSERASSYGLDDFADDLAAALPQGLHSVVGHSLGGAVLERAVGRLRPEQAIYLDPGFHLALPTTGVAGRLFWAAPHLTLGFAAFAQARKSKAIRTGYAPATVALLDAAKRQFDGAMAIDVFRDVAFHPVAADAPAVPSAIILSDDSPAVLPDDEVDRFAARGWTVRRIAGIHHDMHLEAPDRTFATIADLL
jgi:pimeloyl-ACP methyl ester carboxylesterase